MDMSDFKEYDEERVTDDIDVLKLRKLSPQKNIYNIEK